jgi:serine/threonine-protein kinase HipA
MTTISVHVAIGAETVFAGSMYSHRKRGVESSTFSYDNTYITLAGAYAFEPAMPLASAPVQTDVNAKIFRAFGDCAPDTWGRRLILRREAALAESEARAPRNLGEIDFLLGVRDDLRQGALRFRKGEGVGEGDFLAIESDGVPGLTDVPSLLALADKVEKGSAKLPDLQRLIQVGGSLGGAGPKAHVLDSNGRLAIAKFPSSDRDTWNVMAWEKVAFDLAGQAGIAVPRSDLYWIADRAVHIIERFDRSTAGQRIGYVSALTMLEASDGEERSYLEIAEVIERYSDQASDDLKELWRRIVFSVLISNVDDHLRNHGFLHVHDDVWRLSPAFDINPNPEMSATNLKTTIDYTRSELDLGLVMGVADFFRLSAQEARNILNEIAASVGEWRQIARRNKLSESEIRSMAPAFAALDQVSAA